MWRPILGSAVVCVVVACSGPTYQRGSEDPSIDRAAMSTRLDRVDLEDAVEKWFDKFKVSKKIVKAEQAGSTIAVVRIDNDTSERIASALANLIDWVETRIANETEFVMVTSGDIAKSAIAAELRRGDEVDAATRAELGKQLGVQYFISGRVGDTAEKTREARRVQYFLFLRVTKVETGELVFQQQIPITKQITG